MSGPLLGAVLCVFDSEIGHKVVTQFPRDLLSKSSFDVVYPHIITSENRSQRLISVPMTWVGEDDCKPSLISFPVHLHNPSRYPRNIFIFNLCLVAAANTDLRPVFLVAKILGHKLKQIETHTFWVSGLVRPPASFTWAAFLEQLVESLNSPSRELSTLIGDTYPLHVRLASSRLVGCPFEAHSLEKKSHFRPSYDPSFVVIPLVTQRLDFADALTADVLAQCDGAATPMQIALNLDVDLDIVFAICLDLLALKLVRLDPPFRFSDSFILVDKIKAKRFVDKLFNPHVARLMMALLVMCDTKCVGQAWLVIAPQLGPPPLPNLPRFIGLCLNEGVICPSKPGSPRHRHPVPIIN